MRQSPSLLALLTISATLGMASQARGETLPTLPQETDVPMVSVADLLAMPAEPVAGEAQSQSALPTAVAALDESESNFATVTVEAAISSADQTPAAVDPDEAGEAGATPLSRPNRNNFVSVHALLNQPDQPLEGTPAAEMGLGAGSARQLVQVDEATPAAEPDEVDGEIIEPIDDDAATPDDPEGELEDLDIPEVEDPDAPEVDLEELEEDPEILEEEDPEILDEEDPEVLDEEDPEGIEEDQAETQVLVAEVAVTNPAGVPLEPELEDVVYEAIDTLPGQTTTRTQIQSDINSIFATGFFSNVRAVPTDTPLGVRVTFVVDPNPVLTDVQVVGNEALPETVVDDIFAPQYGEIINLLEFQNGILQLNNWYQENGYVLAQVIAAPEIGEDGVVTLQVAEGVIEDIEVRFMTEEGVFVTEEGDPVRGKTRDFIILREFETEPGDVFQQSQIQADLQRVFGLGIFEDVTLTLNPGQKDPRKVDVIVNVVERNTGSVAAGVGFNFTGDIFGTLSYRQDNFGGNNQKFAAEAQLSTRDILFDVSFTDPWIAGDPFRTSYTLNGFARRSIPLVFDGGDNEINLPNGDRVRLNRYGAGVTFRRPLGNDWDASLGTLYQRVIATDADGNRVSEDAVGNPLTASGDSADDLWTVQFGVVQDLRNDPFAPTSGSVLRLGTEQSIPLGAGSIFFNRLRASYSYYFPVSLLNFSEGPQAIAINVQGGTILGDFPPYEAFTLGGTNSVRGYDEGQVGSGQSYLQASIEYRFPLFSFLGGALFLDAATDLGTGDAVPGSPGPDRGKPGSGFGYGAGVRVQTPLGPIRVDYGFSDEGEGRLHFGIGERF
jgi:outer membrane protein insertion porin family